MNYTDDQLKQLLAKMLPEDVCISSIDGCLLWRRMGRFLEPVLDTELLYLCSLLEEGLTENEREEVIAKIVKQMPAFPACNPFNEANFTTFATWQQRVAALAEVKGVAL